MPGGRNPYRSGYRFQQRVKKQLESEGWNVIVRPRSAFPDLLCWRRDGEYFRVWMVECKAGKYLTKHEKEKMKELGERVCDLFMVAWRGKGGEIMFYNPREGAAH